MKKIHKINIVLFCFLILSLIVVAIIYGVNFTKSQDNPWQYQSFFYTDSLSTRFIEKYQVLDSKQALSYIEKTQKIVVVILVDAWGVPTNEALMQEDFSFFNNVSVKILGLHKRLANRTKHAERVELRTNDSIGVYLFGGDSAEYNRKLYIPELGFKETLFCLNCADSVMLHKLDSILSQDQPPQYIALTTQSSRDGDRKKLHTSLKLISDFVQKHSENLFIIQGTHRPILGAPKIREMHYPHWVPLIYANY